jgi:AAA+ ATPase superfamily predicted ATPase
MENNNPFVVGQVVPPELFYGRSLDLEFLKSKILPNNKASISIYGLHRIGKTSLINKFLSDFSKSNQNIKIIKINLANHTSFLDFSKQIAYLIYRNLPSIDYANKTVIESAYNNIINLKEISAWFDFVYNFSDFLKTASNIIKFILVIDEFDHCVNLFKLQSHYFQLLRGISSEYEYQFSVILISRRHLALLEKLALGVPTASVLYLVYTNYALKEFSDEDIKHYFLLLQKNKSDLDKESHKEIIFFAGRFPYLLSLFGDAVYNNPTLNIKSFFYEKHHFFSTFYDNLINLINEDKYLEKIIQLLIGPKFDINRSDILNLLDVNYIYHHQFKNDLSYLNTSESPYFSISEYFSSYYLNYNNEIQNKIWEVLMVTEKQIRKLISTILEKKHSDQWEDHISNLQVSLFNKVKAKRFLEDARIKFSNGIKISILDVISLKELSNILSFYWVDFHNIFLEAYSKEDLLRDLIFLDRARNPLAHANEELLTIAEINHVNDLCKKIQSILDKRIKF